jgi:hypothetical protein
VQSRLNLAAVCGMAVLGISSDHDRDKARVLKVAIGQQLS